MFIKICGITRPEDAIVSEAAGATAIGLVFAESKRQVTKEEAETICEVTNSVIRVGVFDKANSLVEIESRVQQLSLDMVQLHDVIDSFAEKARRFAPVLRAYKFSDPAAAALPTTASPILVDSNIPGSGQAFEWESLQEIKAPFVLAGGLNPDNIDTAVKATNPFGVDVSTGVSDPENIRFKSSEMVTAFVARARLAAQQTQAKQPKNGER